MTEHKFYDAMKLYKPHTGGMPMSISSHLSELKRKHDTLSQQVEAAQRSPSSDDLSIVELKKQKLRLKEEISRLAH